MGTVISKRVNGFGAILGNAFIAPFRAIFGDSCEFVRFFFNSALLFFYLIFKVGIIQCVVKAYCKMCWAACEACWSRLESITCFLCYQLKNTKRVYRGRHDLEHGHSSSGDDGNGRSLKDYSSGIRSLRRRENRRRDHRRSSLHQVRWGSGRKEGSNGGYHLRRRLCHHHLNLITSDVSVHLRTDRLRGRMAGKRMGFKRRRI